MSDITNKGRALADRIRNMHTAVNKGLDDLALRVDDTEKAVPIAFERAHNFIDTQQQSVSEIDDVLRTLSNLPLGGAVDVGNVLSVLPNGVVNTFETFVQRDTVELKAAPGTEALPSGMPANIAAALNK